MGYSVICYFHDNKDLLYDIGMYDIDEDDLKNINEKVEKYSDFAISRFNYNIHIDRGVFDKSGIENKIKKLDYINKIKKNDNLISDALIVYETIFNLFDELNKKYVLTIYG